MANEIKITLSGTLTNGELTDTVKSKRMTIDQSEAAVYVETIPFSTNETQPGFNTDAIASPGIAWVQNLSTANNVLFGPMDGAGNVTAFQILKPQEQFVFRMDATLTSTSIGFVADNEGSTGEVKFKLYGT